MIKSRFILIFTLIALITVNCSSASKKELELNTTETLKVVNNDPLEPVNRIVFSFNIIFDKVVLRPIAIVYKTVVPGFLRNRITYSLNNLSMPITAVNNLLQGEFAKAGISTSRFIINSTIGILGFFDPASSFGLESANEDFGQTLTVWGIPSGPYMMLPFLGPSTPRDFTGLLSTSLLDPMYHVGSANTRDSLRIYGMGGGAIDFRSRNIEIFDDLQNNSVDYYAAVRSFYSQARASQASDNMEINILYDENDIFDDFDIDNSYVGPDIEIEYD